MSSGVDPSSQTDPDWQTEFADEKAHINDLVSHNHIFQAMMYIMTSFFGLLTDYNEGYRMGSQATVENLLSQLQQDRNTIESDFDANQSGQNPIMAQQALDSYADINKILEDNDGKGGVFDPKWVQQVNDEFYNGSSDGTIFQGETTASGLAQKWSQDWQGPSQPPDNAPPNWPSSSDSPQIQGVTNALSAVSTDFSSQSSIAESKLKYYETWDEQYLTVQHSMMSNFIDMEKSPNTSMQSAGS
ncbi:MAG: hypothetical protein H7A42_00475 [Chlamydiales bacterium]|nr:hypothetical protein [Chlamydiales bacterium]